MWYLFCGSISDEYTLPFGVFLFLGYSRAEQDMLYPHTHETVRNHIVKELESMLDVALKKRNINYRVSACTQVLIAFFFALFSILIDPGLRLLVT